ncbi:MAG: aminotransferase class III-fold pyridoxal phosphate-dependent enzyme [Gemmatimonadaceae bacterium]
MSPIDVGRTRHAAVDAAEAQRVARELWGLHGQAVRLDGEYDDNFRLDTSDGAYVLKIAAANEDPALLALQAAALDHVRRRAPESVVPRVRKTLSGEVLGRVELCDTQRLVRLVEFIPGALLADVQPQSAALLRSLGAALGELDVALLDFQHPAAHRQLQWDLRRADALRQEVVRIPEAARRELVTRLIDRVELELLPILAKLRESVIHGDGNDFNIVARDDRVVGVLDFGDMLRTATVCEVAIAGAYAMAGKNDPMGAAAHVVAGYEGVLPLRDSERRALFPLMLTRLAMSVIISAARKTRAPENAYYTVHEERAWRVLEQLVDVPWDMAQDVLFGTRAAADISVSIARRRAALGRNLSLSYDTPLQIVRGWRQYLYDADGREYLDAYNNVPHVGHSHPRVVAAAARQMAVLNTNTRYLHENVLRYAERLTATLPAPLRVCYFVNSGSEANELALRMARAHTRQVDVIVSEGAYHGNTQELVDVSPYKYDGPGGAGRPPHVHEVPVADVYRGAYKANDADAGARYAAYVAEAVEAIGAKRRGVSAFLIESLLSAGGQIVLPRGYLKDAFVAVRDAGGVCIVDEVQVGFGRVGSRFWGFELQDVVPDIVVMGKPMGNGHPVGAVVTSREIADSFDNGMEYFNTFGGNPVSMAVALEVLAVIEDERLQANALRVGERLLSGLRGLLVRHPLIGDVRGAGLFVGIELVRNRETLEPARAEAKVVVNALKDRGILTGTEGPLGNVIKIKPPMVFADADADRLVETLDRVLAAM